jgi:hypothetical protein
MIFESGNDTHQLHTHQRYLNQSAKQMIIAILKI